MFLYLIKNYNLNIIISFSNKIIRVTFLYVFKRPIFYYIINRLSVDKSYKNFINKNNSSIIFSIFIFTKFFLFAMKEFPDKKYNSSAYLPKIDF